MQWREIGIDFEPSRGEIVRDLEEWLELVQGLLRLAHEQLDPHQLVLAIRAVECILGDRMERQVDLTFSYRRALAPQVGKRKTVDDMAIWVLRLGTQLLLDCEPRDPLHIPQRISGGRESRPPETAFLVHCPAQ